MPNVDGDCTQCALGQVGIAKLPYDSITCVQLPSFFNSARLIQKDRRSVQRPIHPPVTDPASSYQILDSKNHAAARVLHDFERATGAAAPQHNPKIVRRFLVFLKALTRLTMRV
ncbi:hypothetical protein [Pseudomonas sp. QTF5]|uniref:hypothetical protein n=1 Tax=Pseudomonas sp. QTF5 TaxID=1435425 RepID=UPI0004BE3400|nr:hypothetical protein [Pseudomonas sp. QTF5]